MMDLRAGLVLLDIEGTVSPLAFVHDVMFPFARQRVSGYLEHCLALPAVAAAVEQMAIDDGAESSAVWCPGPLPSSAAAEWITARVHEWMDRDAKMTGLKMLQGLIWEEGFTSGELRAELFEDVAPVLRQWEAESLELRIYSSGSVHAQKLFFAHTQAGDMTPLFSGYYDTTTGSKKQAASYAAIAGDSGFAPADIVFLSDVVEELDAASEAGMQTVLAIRPGNRETVGARHSTFSSLRDLNIVRP